MKTTPTLSLEYGGLTYDGGLELIAGRNLDKIEAELTRLAGLASIPAPTGFKRGAFTFDAGQERAARDNLLLIQATLTALGTAASSPSSIALDTSLAATDGGSSAAMGRNLVMIDDECARLAAALDGGGGGDYVPPEATGDWKTGAGTIVMVVGRKPVQLPGQDAPTDVLGFQFGGAEPYNVGTGENYDLPSSMLQVCAAQVFPVDDTPRSGMTVFALTFTDKETFNPDATMGTRTMRVTYNGTLVWEGSPDGTGPWPEGTSGPGTFVMELPSLPAWQEGGYLVMEIDAP